MRILVIGNGGREHALARKLAAETQPLDGGGARPNEIHAAPGNPGIAEVARLHEVDPMDGAAIVELARSIQAELVVVGPEAPLVAGVADAVRAAGIPVFGPSKAAAQLEGSKAFSKSVMEAAGVPTAKAYVCATRQEIEHALDAVHAANPAAPYVVKDDGLAAGKGVVVTPDRAAALAHALSCSRVVIEEYLDGPEVSLFAVCGYSEAHGITIKALQPAQDFKRIRDGDEGPNTGGMGSYSPLPWAPAGLTDEVVSKVVWPTLDEMVRRGTPFTGLLFVGLALTSQGTRVIEFNARFGDPETQSLMALLSSPLTPLLYGSATDTLWYVPDPEFAEGAAVTVVMASRGYPETSHHGDTILGVYQAEEPATTHVVQAGTAIGPSGTVVTSGGRVLAVVATGVDLASARAAAYDGVAKIHFDGQQFRSDIAEAAASGRIVL